jgi:multiple sugar transport system substrate-binding protein
MKLKRIAAILLAIIMLTFAGCSSGSSKGDGGKGGTKKVVLLGGARTNPAEAAAWDEVGKAFTTETGIQVEFRWQGTWDQIPQALQAAKLAKEQIDLCIVGAGTVRSTLAPSGSVMDLTELVKDLKDRFTDGAFDSSTIDGKLWTIPFAQASGKLFSITRICSRSLEYSLPQTIRSS